jgi:hypothetical protein
MELFHERVNASPTDHSQHEANMDFKFGAFNGLEQEGWRSPTPDRARAPEVLVQRAHVEDVEDEDQVWMRFIQLYPGQVAKTLSEAQTMFHGI